MERYPRCILATTVLPWGADDRLLPDLFRAEVAGLAAAGYRRLYVFGTAGEGYAVDDALFREVVELFQDQCALSEVTPMVGLISTSFRTIQGRLEWARTRGIREFQISLPSWGPLSDRDLDAFFAGTCGAYPDCRFLHYNLGRARRVLEPADYARLASRHPNLVATKQAGLSNRETAAELHRAAPQVRHFFGESMFAGLGTEYPCGLLISVGLIRPELGRAFFAAVVGQDGPTAETLAGEIATATRLLLAAGGEGPCMDGTYDKAIWKLQAPEFPLRLLPPFHGMSEAAFQGFVAALRREAPRWAPPDS